MALRNITRVVTLLSGAVIGAIAIILPLIYFFMSFRYMAGSLETEAEVNANIITDIVNKNPENWEFEQTRLEEQLSKRSRQGYPETRRIILNRKNEIVAESANHPKKPVMMRSFNIYDSGMYAGRIEIHRSLQPLLVRSALIALIELPFGLLFFFILRILPLKALSRAEESLKETNEFLNKVMGSTTNAIMVVTTDGKIIHVNRRASDMSGYPPDELVGRPLSLLFAPETFPAVRENVNKIAMREVERVKFETQLSRRNGQAVTIMFGAAQLFHAKGDINVVISLEDVTERVLAEKLLEQNNRELEEAYAELKAAQSHLLQQEKMASIGQLAAGVAHEINNPTGFITSNLGSLQKYTERLSEFIIAQSEVLEGASAAGEGGNGNLSAGIKDLRRSLKIDYILEDTRNLIRESLDGADRIRKIVQDLKSFSHTGDSEVKMADINAGLESTINIVWNELKYKATVTKEYGDIPETKCNPGQLNQVFVNMLVNAAHAIEKQGEIRVKTWHEGEHIHISISDTGCGIPEDRLSRIFEPFYTTKEVGKGTGLGLSIAYDIVKKHNGEIRVKSEIDKGTTFTVRVPVILVEKE